MAGSAGPAGATDCLPPVGPLPFRLEQSDPLYGAVLDEHRRYLDAMEKYVNCLDRARADALATFRRSFEQFGEFFGDDATFVYEAKPPSSGQGSPRSDRQ